MPVQNEDKSGIVVETGANAGGSVGGTAEAFDAHLPGRMAWCVAASVALHLIVAVMLVVSWPVDHAAKADPQPEADALDVLQQRIVLGDPDRVRNASMAWIGGEVALPMRAPELDVDQAAESRLAGLPSQPIPPAPAVAAASSPAEPSETAGESAADGRTSGAVAPESVGAAEAAAAGSVDAIERFAQQLESLLNDGAELMLRLPMPTPVAASGQAADQEAASGSTGDSERGSESEAERRRAEERPTSRPEDRPSRPTPSSASGGERPSRPSDRETDASTTIRVETADLGQPISAQGLRIETTRPDFSGKARATLRPRHPLVEVTFGRDGRVTLVEIVQTSGHADDVDEPILTAVYNWRATGEAIEALKRVKPGQGPATVSVRIRIRL